MYRKKAFGDFSSIDLTKLLVPKWLTPSASSGLLLANGGIIAAVLTMVGIIFLALMVYAGILWMTARGKDDQVERAREIIIASVIGLFIVVSAYAITAFVTGRLSQ